TIYLNDARGALALSEQTYDAVVAQASHPWTAGASHLYTREFFELVKKRLSDEGVFVQWMGTAFVDLPLLRSLIASLADVFPHVNVVLPRGGSLLFVGSKASFDLVDNATVALERFADDYTLWGVDDVEDFVAVHSLDDSQVRAFAAGAPLTTDDHNLLAARSARLGAARLRHRHSASRSCSSRLTVRSRWAGSNGGRAGRSGRSSTFARPSSSMAMFTRCRRGWP
ncbi:MAG: fused MFS/spermidine synthase, partial [Deltaproteobacteria bacterium]|nr:fused MFS/spermidine synthase [Deltaproteobacteria bacterium]